MVFLKNIYRVVMECHVIDKTIMPKFLLTHQKNNRAKSVNCKSPQIYLHFYVSH